MVFRPTVLRLLIPPYTFVYSNVFSFQMPILIFTSTSCLYFYLQVIIDYNDYYVKHYLILFLLSVLI